MRTGGGERAQEWVERDASLDDDSNDGTLRIPFFPFLPSRRGVIPERDSRAEYDDNSEDDRQDSD